jgi:RimJ/RimL family protein N-acetyltransferase
MTKEIFREKIEGKLSMLKGLNPEYFDYIIKWRNDRNVNRFLNQKQPLTYESQKKWYEEYLQKSDEIMYVMHDKESGIPFGTIGLSQFDTKERHCLQVRLLVGDAKYLGTKHFVDAYLTFYGYLFSDLGVEKCYTHSVEANKKVVNFGKRLGYIENEPAKYPQYLNYSGMKQREFVLAKDRYEHYSNKIRHMLNLI